MEILSSFSRLGNLLMLGPQGELGLVTEQKTFQFDLDLTRRFAGYAPGYLKQYAANPDDHHFRVGLIYQSSQQKPWGTETLLFTDTVVRALYPVSGAGRNELTAFQLKKRENSVYYGMELLLEYALKDSPGVPIFLPILFNRGTTLEHYTAMMRDTLKLENRNTPVIEVLNLIGPTSNAHRSVDLFLALKERIHNALIRKEARKPVEIKIMESMRGGKDGTSNDGAAGSLPDPATPPARTTPSVAALNSDADSVRWYSSALHDETCQRLQAFLARPRQYAEVELVRNFTQFRALNPNQQKALAESCPIYAAPAGSPLLVRDTDGSWNLYLLQGDVELTAADGEKRIVSGGSDKASNAIASLRPRKFSVMAVTPVRFLWIHDAIMTEIKQRHPGTRLLS